MNQIVRILRELAFSGGVANMLLVKRSEEALEVLCREVNADKADINDERLQNLLRDITIAEHLKLACDTLARSGSLRLMERAVYMNPNLGKQCADDVMVIVRKHLTTPYDAETAAEALSLLEYAHVWYKGAGMLTPELETELKLVMVLARENQCSR